jgi:teichuronic acid biosynthesis glycosyltransferase TuaG
MSTENGPLVSIIMPFFNSGNYLHAAISSVLSQTYSNFELLLINDGSQDNSEDIALKVNDTRIRYFKQINQGVSAARNNGIQRMQGDYFCFLDSDDIMPERSLQTRIEKFLEEPDLLFCDGTVEVYDDTMNSLVRVWSPVSSGRIFEKLICLDGSCFFGSTWLVRRMPGVHYILETDMTHCEDLYFYVTIARQGKYGYVREPILKNRKNSNSAMNNYQGLARGYELFEQKVKANYSTEMSFLLKITMVLRIRRIMFLSFLSRREFKNAFFFLFRGKVL